MITLRFEVPGNPRGKGRPRFSRGAAGGKSFVRTHTDAKTAAYENLVALAAAEAAKAAGISRLDGPVAVAIQLYFERPKRLLKKSSPEGLIVHTSKPDADNVAKAILDGLSALVDDATVWSLVVSKYYTTKPGAPRASITIVHDQGRPQ